MLRKIFTSALVLTIGSVAMADVQPGWTVLNGPALDGFDNSAFNGTTGEVYMDFEGAPATEGYVDLNIGTFDMTQDDMSASGTVTVRMPGDTGAWTFGLVAGLVNTTSGETLGLHDWPFAGFPGPGAQPLLGHNPDGSFIGFTNFTSQFPFGDSVGTNTWSYDFVLGYDHVTQLLTATITDSFGPVNLSIDLSGQTGTFDAFGIADPLGNLELGNAEMGVTLSNLSYDLTSIPEPASLSLLALGGLLMAKRTRRA